MPETVTIQAVGFNWTVGPLDPAANYMRSVLVNRVIRFVSAITNPVSRAGAVEVLDGYYPDVVSSLHAVEPVEPVEGFNSDDFIIELLASPVSWFNLAINAYGAGLASELIQLHAAVIKLNPLWYGVNEPGPKKPARKPRQPKK